MAKTKKAASKPTGNELLENPDALAEQISKSEEFLEKNKNIVIGVLGVVILGIAGYLGYSFYTDNQNQAAQKELFQAVYYFEAEEWGKALNGDGNSYGFLDIISEYGMTDAANLASFYAGVSYLRMGDFDAAIRNLKKFSSSDLLVQARAYSLIGDAYAEQDNLTEALNYYSKASTTHPNKEFTPVYLMKAAATYEAAKEIKKAIDMYKRIIEEYPDSPDYQEAKKQKTRLEGL